ncbi:lipopolysaccharide biosynthesis protein [Vibrio splendidus]
MSKFSSNLKKILSANIIAQVIGVASLPLISRIYTPEAFGLFSTFILIQAVLISIITLRVEWVIPNKSEDKEAKLYFEIGYSFAFLVCFAMFIVSLLLLFILGISDNLKLLLFLSFSGIFSAVYALFQSIFIRANNLEVVARSKLIQIVITTLTTVLFGYIYADLFSLMLAYILGYFFSTLTLYRNLDRDSFGINDYRVIFRGWNSILNKVPELFSLANASIANVILNSLILILVTWLYSPHLAGIYAMVHRILTAPISLISTAVVQSFWAEVAELKRNKPNEMSNFYYSVLIKLFCFSIPFSIFVFVGSDYLLLVLGDEWFGVESVAKSIIPLLIGVFVFSPTNHLIVYEKISWQRNVDVLSIFLVILVFVYSHTYDSSFQSTIYYSSLVILIGYVIKFILHIFASKIFLDSLMKER